MFYNLWVSMKVRIVLKLLFEWSKDSRSQVTSLVNFHY